MGANNVYTIDPSELCLRADEYLSCELNSYIVYDKYKVGPEPEFNDMMRVVRLRRAVCENRCRMSEEDLYRLSEKLNKLVS